MDFFYVRVRPPSRRGRRSSKKGKPSQQLLPQQEGSQSTHNVHLSVSTCVYFANSPKATAVASFIAPCANFVWTPPAVTAEAINFTPVLPASSPPTPSTLPYDRQMLVDNLARNRKMLTEIKTMTPMEPSRGSLVSAACSSGDTLLGEDDRSNLSVDFTPSLVEEDLFAIPSDLKPSYSPLDRISRVLVAGFAWNIALLWNGTVKSRKIRQLSQELLFHKPILTLTQILLEIRQASWRTAFQWLRWFAGFLLQCAVINALITIVLQDIFLRPSRISTEDLRSKFALPSPLSRFQQIPVETPNGNPTLLGVHWLQCNSDGKGSKTNYNRVLYCNHGFGASSLSFLPCLKRVTEKLGCQTGMAHDALGFGFSEAPEVGPDGTDYWYSWSGSATIAKSLLHKHSTLGQNGTAVLMGHSMGALTTLRLALNLPEEVPKRIILIAPALGASPVPASPGGKSRGRASTAIGRATSWLLETPTKYILRRAVGTPGFWRRGLKAAWGDSTRLKDSDVLRFQWPSVHDGWEAGLLRFAKSGRKSFPNDPFQSLSDKEILTRVLALPNTTVEVILGGKDRIVSPQSARRFLESFPPIPITELPDMGHDPFEENVESFLQALH